MMKKRVIYIIFGLLVALFIIMETFFKGFGQNKHAVRIEHPDHPAFAILE